MPAQPASRKELKLPPFKEENPVAWFKQAEAYFRIHGETDRELWFFYVQWALTPLQEKLVQDIISTDHTPPNAYGLLKERLLQLYEKGERARCRKLLDLPPIGGRRPSELLAEMSTLCPRVEQNSNLFRYMFYFRLPPRIKELLGEDNQSSIVERAARADTFTMNKASKAEAAACACTKSCACHASKEAACNCSSNLRCPKLLSNAQEGRSDFTFTPDSKGSKCVGSSLLKITSLGEMRAIHAGN
jgi:hypothetical protein